MTSNQGDAARLIGRRVRIVRPTHRYAGCIGNVIDLDGADFVVDVDGDEVLLARSDFYVLIVQPTRPQRMAEFIRRRWPAFVLITAALVGWSVYYRLISMHQVGAP